MRFWSRVVFNTKRRFDLKLVSGSLFGAGVVCFYCFRENAFLSAKTIDANLETDVSLTNKEEFGVPGIIVGVSKNGRMVYSQGFGYSDVENNVKAHAHTVVRIASISKPISCTLAARLFESGKLDIDRPIAHYLPDLAPFKYNGNECQITSRQLMCHASGVRHYDTPNAQHSDQKQADSNQTDKNLNESEVKAYKNIYPVRENSNDKNLAEFFLNKHFKTTKEALEIFKNDPLRFEPGKGYLYSTFGFTLLSAVLERCVGAKSFPDMLTDMFNLLDMKETYLDYNDPLITYRSKYYIRNGKKRLVNVPCVDNSYKWAGGGILSTVGDLLKYGNQMLASYQSLTNSFLKAATVKSYVWATQSTPPPKNNEKAAIDSAAKETETYGLGWHLCFDKQSQLKYVYHTGGAVGATTCILIVPTDDQSRTESASGVVVAVLCNLQECSDIVKLSLNISKLFTENE